MNLSAHKKMLSSAAAVSVMLITAACGGGSGEPSPSTSSSAAASDDAADPGASGDFKDGDYEGKGRYPNPGGTSDLDVKLTLKGNEVTALNVTPEATNGTSKQYQTQFAGGVAEQVVGKSLDELDVSKVAGSSLTSEGFSQAIEEIKADAAG